MNESACRGVFCPHCGETVTGAEDTGDDEPIGDWDRFDPELLRSAWADEDADDGLPDTSDTGVAGVIIKWIVLLLLSWKSRYAVSDAAIESIFQIFCTIFSYLSGLVSFCGILARSFPKSVSSASRIVGLESDKFKKFVVCPRCHTLYMDDRDCFRFIGSRRVPLQCSHVEFRHHPQPQHRRPCNGPLMQEVQHPTKSFIPYRTYCYRSVQETLRCHLLRPGFAEACEAWRSRVVPENVLADVYDGSIWKEFMYVDGEPFLAKPRNYGFMLNVDWFQPFKHSPYSVGAIYLVLLNLPRSVRLKKENIFIVGIIPGPHEPSLSINTYLKPLVDELEELWKDGICLKSAASPLFSERYRCALLCVACDIPASRKVGGFLAHSARKGCNKCLVDFPSMLSSEADRTSILNVGPARENDIHREIVAEVLTAPTRQDRDRTESENGVRYSELLRLPYYQPIQFVVLDPMHNLFLGTAKTFLKDIWTHGQSPLISKAHLLTVQERIDSIHVPSSIGRIPRKIASNFASLTADQWRSWTTVFSPVCLRDLLPPNHLACWLKYVEACRLFCKRAISVCEVQQADELISNFLENARMLYPSHLTPNMHMHQHLADCIRNYGPAPAFWLFGFERLNGILGAYKTNRKNVEIQVMKKLLMDLALDDTVQPEKFREIFRPVFEKVQGEKPVLGALASSLVDINASLILVGTDLASSTAMDCSQLLSTTCLYRKQGPFHSAAFSCMEVQYLATMYKVIFGETCTGLVVPEMHTVFRTIEIAGQVVGSRNSRHESSSYILASWAGTLGRIVLDGEDRPGQIEHFVHHRVLIGDKWHDCVLAAVRWNYKHNMKDKFDGVTLWCSDHFEDDGPSSYMPVQRIKSLFCPAYDTVSHSRVMFPCPLSLRLCL